MNRRYTLWLNSLFAMKCFLCAVFMLTTMTCLTSCNEPTDDNKIDEKTSTEVVVAQASRDERAITSSVQAKDFTQELNLIADDSAGDIELRIYYQKIQEAIFIIGETSLPNGTNLSGDLMKNGSIAGQAKGRVQDGKFKLGGFSDRGRSHTGELQIRIYSVFNNIWQDASILSKLLDLNSPLITRGKTNYGDMIKLEVSHGLNMNTNETAKANCSIQIQAIQSVLNQLSEKINKLRDLDSIKDKEDYAIAVGSLNRMNIIWADKATDEIKGNCCIDAERFTRIAINEYKSLGLGYASAYGKSADISQLKANAKETLSMAQAKTASCVSSQTK